MKIVLRKIEANLKFVLVLFFAGCALLVLGGCAQRAFFKPRSEVLEDSSKNGKDLPTVEVEKDLFFSHDKATKERLFALIKKRTAPGVRDLNYRLGAEDQIDLNVFDVPELNLQAKINQAGFISLPLIGGVKALGLTESELAAELKKRLTSYVKDPQVSVFVGNYGSQKVAVIGAVRKPGNYPLKKGENTIVELINQAGGITEKAGNFINFVPAEASGMATANDPESRASLALSGLDLKDSRIEVALDEVLGTSGGIPIEIPVRGGDMVIIPEGGKVMVEGEVQKGGTYELGQQLTVLGALAAAGGITYGAKVDEVEVIRDYGTDKKGRLLVSLPALATGEARDIRLRNGDILRVPSDSGRRMTQDTFEGLSRIINFGVGGSVNLMP